ncbi:hypothetical protein M1N05_00420 [Dehalococcoidales bacterium]|nr:hypothetical protein [Dehalococcoidales bacterium]
MTQFLTIEQVANMLIKRVIEHRNQLPPLGISTAELIREAKAIEGALYGQ